MSASKTLEEVTEIRRKNYDLVWPLVNDLENKHWTLQAGTDKETTGLVYKGHHDTLGTIWKLEVVLDIDIDHFEEIFIKKPQTEWMPNLSEFRRLEEHMKASDTANWGWAVNYTRTKGKGTFNDRDFVALGFHEKLENGWIFDITVSTTHPDDPKPTDGCVRGEQLPSGSIIRRLPNDPNRVELIWMNNMDMKGYLPRTLINLILSTILIDMAKPLIAKCKKVSAERNGQK